MKPLRKAGVWLQAALRMPLNIRTIARSATRPITVQVSPPVVQVSPVVNLPPESPWRDIAPNSEAALFKAISDSALARTVRIVEQEMPDALILLDGLAFLRLALSKAPVDGAHCEFGVFSGATINHLAEQRPQQTFHGFDSFHGLPEDWSGYMPFDFDRKGTPPEVKANVRLHVGLFEDTLPVFAAAIERVAFLHVDCDLYSSTATIFRHLGPKLMRGCVIAFDEYFCYPGFEQHERKAFREFLEVSGRTATWIACCGQRAACSLN